MKSDIATRAPRLRPLVACVAIALAMSSSHAFGDARDRNAVARSFEELAALRDPVFAFVAEHSDPSRRLLPPFAPADVPRTLVTNCDDDGPGSLRQAFHNASSGDIIDLTQLTCSTITLTSGALDDSPTAADVSVQGPGKYLLTIDGGGTDRVFQHNGSGALAISGMTITNGSYGGALGGGCIYSAGDVQAFYTLVSSCSKTSSGSDDAFGGAIYARGGALIAASTIVDNTAHADAANSAGAGVWANTVQIAVSTISGNTVSGDGSHYARGGGVLSLGDIEIVYSTISDNEASAGGGVFLIGAAENGMNIRNSTISGNHASGSGGGIYAKYRPLAVSNSTIASNTAGDQCGGMFLAYATELESTIVANNTAQNAATADVGSPYAIAISGANNLVIASNVPMPPDTITLNPMLGPLQDNGGYSMTHALLAGSPAIDHGNNSGAAQYDQRLFVAGSSQVYERVVGPGADIGAFEFGAPDRIFADGFEGEL
jgi:hypothetical protein